MPPNCETEEEHEDIITKKYGTNPRKLEIYFWQAVLLTYYHIAALYGIYLCFTSAKWTTIGFSYLMYLLGMLGVTAGAHRLWTHKSYKAKRPLQVLLILLHSLSFQQTVITWCRNHRLHHKFSDTDADPYNANCGFFFSHMGWLVAKKSDEVIKEQKLVDMSDMYSNPLLSFQKKYALPCIGTFCFLLPTVIPMYFWSETLNNAWHLNFLRFMVTLHAACCINSIAHIWGYKPYDKNINPTQNLGLSIATLGEGFHNFHHVFPWDYQTSELGNRYWNITTLFIDLCSWLGLAYDLKTASADVVKNRTKRTGDGTDLWGECISKLPE